MVYLLLDWGSIAPYLVTNAAVPLEAIILQRLPEHDRLAVRLVDAQMDVHGAVAVLLLPLIFGGKIYNSLKMLMSFKLIAVIGFLLFLGIFFAKPASWIDIHLNPACSNSANRDATSSAAGDERAIRGNVFHSRILPGAADFPRSICR